MQGDSNKTCFVQTREILKKSEDCLKFFNPVDEKHFRNTLINWTNIYLEIFALVNLNE